MKELRVLNPPGNAPSSACAGANSSSAPASVQARAPCTTARKLAEKSATVTTGCTSPIRITLPFFYRATGTMSIV